jgi:type IV pilus assembly protein PilB
METSPRLGEILIANHAIDPTQLDAALGHQRRWGGRLGQILVGLGFTSERAITRALSRQMGVPEVDLSTQTISDAVLSKVPFEVCQKHRLIPLAIRRDERGAFLHVAMADPSDLEALDDLRFHTGLRVEAAVASEVDIEFAIRKHFRREIEQGSPFGEARKLHQSTGELLRFGEPPVTMDEVSGPFLADEGKKLRAVLQARNDDRPQKVDGPSDPFAASDPALRAVEALVRILARKGILEKGEFLQEILREMDEDDRR